MSSPSFRLLSTALILAMVTAPWPSPRPASPFPLPRTTLRGRQVNDAPKTLSRSGLTEAVRHAGQPFNSFESGLEEGALFTWRGQPIRLEPDLFDPVAEGGAFKLLVLAWLIAHPGKSDREYEQRMQAAITAVTTHSRPLGDPVNTGTALKVWAVLGVPEPPPQALAQCLAEAVKADILRAASDPGDRLRPVRSKLLRAAQALRDRGEGSPYQALVEPAQAALARIVTVQQLLNQLRSDDHQAQGGALTQLYQWLRWPRLRGVPDAVAWQAAALADAVASLHRPRSQSLTDWKVGERADQVARLMRRRQLVGMAPAAPAISLDPAMIRFRLETLHTVARTLEDIVIAGGVRTFDEAAMEILHDPRSATAGLPTARELGALWNLEDDERSVAVKFWGPDRLALVTWTPRIARIIEARHTQRTPLDAGALYRDLEEHVGRLRKDLEAPGRLAEEVAHRVKPRLVYWDSARAWPTAAARAEAFTALITRIKAHVGLPAGLEEPARAAAEQRAVEVAEATQRLTELLDQANLTGRTIVIGPEALGRCPALGGFRGLHAQVLVPERSTMARGQLVAEAAALKVRAFIYAGDAAAADEVRRLAGKSNMSVSEVIALDLSPDKVPRQMYRLLRIPGALWTDMSQLRQIFQDLDTRSQA